MSKVYPRCQIDMKSLYVSCEGIVMPCCWIGNQPFVDSYLDFHKAHLDSVSIEHHSLDDILKSEEYLSLQKTWSTLRPFSGCIHFCSTPPPKGNMQGTNRVSQIEVK